MEPDKQNPEMDVAEGFVEHFPGELGPPEIESGKHRKHHGAEDHVMEVGNHKVRVRHVEVQWR